MAKSLVDVKYDEELVKRIQELFINKIVPENFLLLVHKYDKKVLTLSDIERLRKSVNSKAQIDVNYDLLLTIKNYEDWFDVILKVCKDDDVKQEFLVEEFERCKRDLDEIWPQHQTQKKELDSKLRKKSTLASDEALEADADVCVLSENTQCVTENRTGSSDGGQDEAKLQYSDKGWEMKNGKGYCYSCCVELTSEKFKDLHIDGQKHKEKIKHIIPNSSFDEQQTAANSEPTSDSNKATAACSKSTSSCNDEYYILDDKGTGKCNICHIVFTSAETATQHLAGIKHKKKIEALKLSDYSEVPPELGPNGEIYVIDERGIGKCYVCKIPLTSKQHAKQHFDGRKHINVCKKYGLKL